MNQSFFLDRASGLHRLHPLTKLTLALVLVVAAFTLRWTFAPLAIFILIVLPLAAWGKILPEVLRTTLIVILPLAVSLALVQGLFFPGAQTVLWQIGPFSLKQEGLEFAFVTATRLMVIAGAGLVLVYSTHPADLALALVQAGAPYSLAYIVVTAIQLLPEMQARVQRILNAQQARGLETEGSLRVRLAALVPLTAPLIYGALESVQERALALDARAFRAPRRKTSWRELHDSGGQRALRYALTGFAVLLVGLALLTVWLPR